jgi:hypothetical protein
MNEGLHFKIAPYDIEYKTVHLCSRVNERWPLRYPGSAVKALRFHRRRILKPFVGLSLYLILRSSLSFDGLSTCSEPLINVSSAARRERGLRMDARSESQANSDHYFIYSQISLIAYFSDVASVRRISGLILRVRVVPRASEILSSCSLLTVSTY